MTRLTAEDPLQRERFPLDEWGLVEVQYSQEDVGSTETVFSLGNGYLGMRANPEEGRGAYSPGTFINGFHETWPIRHAEDAYGFAKVGQTIINVPDTMVMALSVDGQPFRLNTADLEGYRRWIDFREGILHRELRWRTPSGKLVEIKSKRMISFTDRHLALMTFEVTMLSGTAQVEVSSHIINRADGRGAAEPAGDSPWEFDPRKAAGHEGRVLEPEGQWHSGERVVLGYRSVNSGMTICVGTDHTVQSASTYQVEVGTQPDGAHVVYRMAAQEGVPLRVEKAVAYHTGRGVPVEELAHQVNSTLDAARALRFTQHEDAQREWLGGFWHNADVQIPGHPSIQQAVRWCIFQIAQASARAEDVSVAAKGVSGAGYEGHYFWDTEIYVVPLLMYTNPELARNLLYYRYTILDKARQRAAELNLKGALFPWRTIGGDEASAYYPAGTAQYHIDADVAYAFTKYEQMTGDTEFMYRVGAEVLAETARMWADLGFWRDGAFHIHSVTGPDEYTAVVNNNVFTNMMARANLASAVEVLRRMHAAEPAAYAALASRIGLQAEELTEWEKCAAGMFIPYDEAARIHPQDEHFLEREVWDLPGTPMSKRPLLLHYHPLVIYRYQVLKQADVVLAMLLQGDQFTAEDKRRNFDYYDPLTSGDSTLSAVVQSIIASEVGYSELALRHVLEGLFVDLADLHKNTADGVHIASAGGVWNSLVYGFGGMRDHGGALKFDPRLPAEWEELSFRLKVHGSLLEVNLRQHQMTFRILDGTAPVSLAVRGEELRVVPGEQLRVELAHQGPRLPGGPTRSGAALGSD